MKTLNKLMQEIINLTTELETKYPELYRSLDETPLFAGKGHNGPIGKEELKSYLDTLKKELERHLASHGKKH